MGLKALSEDFASLQLNKIFILLSCMTVAIHLPHGTRFYKKQTGVCLMSLIACLSECVYQQDGYCALERAASCGLPSESESCVHFVPRRHSGAQTQPDSVHQVSS